LSRAFPRQLNPILSRPVLNVSLAIPSRAIPEWLDSAGPPQGRVPNRKISPEESPDYFTTVLGLVSQTDMIGRARSIFWVWDPR